jgi:hypothetical protein
VLKIKKIGYYFSRIAPGKLYCPLLPTGKLLLVPVLLGGLAVSVLAIERKARGFKSSRGRWTFKGDKGDPQHTFLRRGSKAVGPMSQAFMAC